MFDIKVRSCEYDDINITLKKDPFKISFKQKDRYRFLDLLEKLLEATKKKELYLERYSCFSTSDGIVEIFIGNSHENSIIKLQNKEGIRLLEDMIEKIHEI